MPKFLKGTYFKGLLVFSLAFVLIGLLIRISSAQMPFGTVLPLGIASFAVGCTMPLLTSLIMGLLSKSDDEVIPSIVVAISFIVGYGMGSGALVYLSTFDKNAAPVIALAAACGVGVVRLIRNEL